MAEEQSSTGEKARLKRSVIASHTRVMLRQVVGAVHSA